MMVASPQPNRTCSAHHHSLAGADWLTLPPASCEVNVSATTVRRMIRKGLLTNCVVPRRGGYTYLIYLPGSRHDGGLCTAGAQRGARSNGAHAAVATADRRHVLDLERQVERLSHALARALRVKQKALPRGVGEPDVNPDDPYARYRWLVHRRKWWPFR